MELGQGEIYFVTERDGSAHTPVPLPRPGSRAERVADVSMVSTAYTRSMGA